MTIILNITCNTSDSPPTKVVWYRDGETIVIDGIDYDTEQVVTNRHNMYLRQCSVREAAERHEYKCEVENTEGNDMHSITTNVPGKHPITGCISNSNLIFLPVYNTTEITTSGSKEQGDRLVLTCTVELHEKLSTLLSYVQLQWVGPNGVPMMTNNNIIDGVQTYGNSHTSLTLTFDPLSTSHSGLYRCIISISIPSLVPFFQREIRYDCPVISKNQY